MASKRVKGIRNFHYATVTADTTTTTYGTPVAVAGIIALKISKNISEEKLYADDALEDTIYANDSYDVELELSSTDLATRAALQGSDCIKGTIIENKDDVPPDVAIGFQAIKGNGKFRYAWLLKGKFKPVSDEYKTIEDKATSQTVKLTGTFTARVSDGVSQMIADEDETGAVPATLTAWFTAVPSVPTAV
jgi:phi13 family phage major tail protein